MKTHKFADSTVVETKKINTHNWQAWIDKMPPPPDTLHVLGEVEVSNPGVEVALFKKQPQGINRTIILLDLFLFQRPGVWPDVVVCKQAAYREVGRNLNYVSAEVFYQGTSIASFPVDIIH
jgi:hypothetical protein